ncbi:MAG: Serine threonine kinase [Trebouxia sp. A1-2]|nr:MAG: Serine threonine kinase [Trebouxia sp. A1-2]
MAYGGTVKSSLPPKVPRPPSLSQNDFTVKASNFARGPQQEASGPVSPGAQTGEWHWPSLTTAEEDEDPATKFELLIQLGRGSYGSVYKAQVRGTQEVVAVKVIPLGDKDEVLEIQKEIEMLKECNHANVVRYLGSWRGSEALWIVMEYCGGGSVADLMHASDVPLDQDMISYICAETLAGLAYLHSIGKVHRDIKCGNILLTEAGEVKVADFGVAAQLSNTMSKRNTFIGTPHWMAPEVIQESRYDGKVDVWALGISAVEMAEVTPPRWSVHPMRVIFMISRDPPPRLADRDRWSLTFHDFVAQCLQKEPKVRPSAKYLLQHKEAAAGHTGQFSWRAGPSGTVLAQHGSAPSTTGGPARGPWANTGMVRARLAGLSFGGPAQLGQHQAGQDSGTMLAYGTGPMPGATMVINADASSRAGTLGPAGTFVTAGAEEGPQGGSDYQAAVQAASQGADG